MTTVGASAGVQRRRRLVCIVTYDAVAYSFIANSHRMPLLCRRLFFATKLFFFSIVCVVRSQSVVNRAANHHGCSPGDDADL